MSKAFVSSGRIGLVAGAVFFAFCVLLGRLVQLHVIESESLRAHLEDRRKVVRLVEARRGNIVDRRGNLLATTKRTVNLGVDPGMTRPEDREKLPELAALLGKPLSGIQAAFDQKIRPGDGHPMEVKPVRWAFLAKGIDEDTYEAVQKLDIRGVYGNPRYERVYPGGTQAAHILGYVNREETAVTGVERMLDFYLRGQDGWRESERDGKQRELARFRNRQVDPTDGLNASLTIDQMVQHIAEREINRLVEEFDPAGVSVIVSEPGTGEILALANHPTFDPNEYYKTEKYPIASQRNRAITDRFEPGSTFKIVPASAVLNEGIARPGDRFPTEAKRVLYEGRRIGLPDDHRRHENLSLDEIVIKSSNRGAAHLGLRLGEHRLHQYAGDFGFGQPTGLGLPGEVAGKLHPVRNWDGLTITRMPMGHALNATPIQIHQAMSVLANGGVLMEPRIAKRVFGPGGGDVLDFEPRAKRRVVSARTASIMAGFLTEVVSRNGTARRAAIDDYEVAGKTGTTQKLVDGRYSSERHVATFSGFFPARRPELVITVVVDEPRLDGIGYGGVVAAPAFRNIAEDCIAYLGIPPASGDESFIAFEPSPYDQSGRSSR